MPVFETGALRRLIRWRSRRFWSSSGIVNASQLDCALRRYCAGDGFSGGKGPLLVLRDLGVLAESHAILPTGEAQTCDI